MGISQLWRSKGRENHSCQDDTMSKVGPEVNANAFYSKNLLRCISVSLDPSCSLVQLLLAVYRVVPRAVFVQRQVFKSMQENR